MQTLPPSTSESSSRARAAKHPEKRSDERPRSGLFRDGSRRPPHCRAPVLLILLASAALVAVHPAAAQSPSASTESSSAIPAPTIPPPQPTALPAPDPQAVSELDTALAKIAGTDEAARKSAISDLADGDATLVPAIAAKLANLRKTADRDGMSKILASARKKGRSSAEDDDPGPSRKRDKDKSDDKEPQEQQAASACNHDLSDTSGSDWLAAVLASSERDKPGYKDPRRRARHRARQRLHLHHGLGARTHQRLHLLRRSVPARCPTPARTHGGARTTRLDRGQVPRLAHGPLVG